MNLMFIVLIEFTVTNYHTFGWKSVNFLVGHILYLLMYTFITWLNPQGSCLKIKWTKFDIS